MGVVGTRVSLVLEQNVREYCRGLGKTPSVWLRELVEKEISGKTPSPAVGDAIKELNELVSDNAKFMIGILAVSLSVYNTLIQCEISNHPERAKQLENAHREFVAGLTKNLPLKEQLTAEMGVRISDLASEIERIKAEGKDRKYNKEVLLPAEVEAESMETQYKSGIMEIKLTKKTPESGGGN